MPDPNGQNGESYIDRTRLRNCGEDLLRRQAILRDYVQRISDTAKRWRPPFDRTENERQAFDRGTQELRKMQAVTKQKMDALIALADETFRRKPTQPDTDTKNPGNHS